MNRAVPDEIIEEIRVRCDIVDLINSYLPLKKSGGRWKACCPFHQEKTPSFIVEQKRQRYHCFGCGKGGDVFRFIMDKEGVDFPNAAHLLARRVGVLIPEVAVISSGGFGGGGENAAAKRERLYEINRFFAEWYASLLHGDPELPVAVYLKSRTIPDDIAVKFQLGAAPDGWDLSLRRGREKGFGDEELLECGITVKNEETGRVYDRFRNRLIFPIWNEQGRVVAFSARTIEKNVDGAKYVNSPETPVFRKSNILYALPLARQGIQQRGYALLCEGQLDVIAMHRAGFTNAVAPQGTAFTDEQARILKRYSERIYVAFDADAAGQKAVFRALELTLPLGFEVKVVCFPAGRDPDEIFKSGGTAELQKYIDAAGDFFEFLYEKNTAAGETASPSGKSRTVSAIIPYLDMLENAVARELYLGRLASRLNIRIDVLFAELKKYRAKPVHGIFAGALPVPAEANGAVSEDLPPQVAKAESLLLELSLNSEEITLFLAEKLPSEYISGAAVGKALNEIIGLAMNGEWNNAVIRLSELDRANPNPELSRLLAAECSIPADKFHGAAVDCIQTVIGNRRAQQKVELMRRIRETADQAEKEKLMKQYLEVCAS